MSIVIWDFASPIFPKRICFVIALPGGTLIEGQDVRKGDLLFTIDPRPYEAALKQAEANLQRDVAQEKHAQEDARRYESLIQKGVVPQQQ